jgi:hypothetical protein
MANRIPVVISQHERRAGSIADYEEQLITRIVMESGLDATLIADLKSIELDTTDHLCIEGLKGDFALATWESAPYVCSHLHRLGIPSLEIIPVDGSPKTRSGDAKSQLPKKIFMIALATDISLDATIKTLKDLLLSRSTPVFSIGGPIGSDKRKAADHPSVVDSKQLPPALTNILSNSSRVGAPKQIVSALPNVDGNFPNIDQLMDELDRFEI